MFVFAGGSQVIENACAADIAQMVHLSEAKRLIYEKHQPVFWKRAEGSAEAQRAYLNDLLGRPNVIALVCRINNNIEGFIIGVLKDAPPVYTPGGLTCIVDDFCVREVADWGTVGVALFQELSVVARGRGGAQLVVVCGFRDLPKRSMLQSCGCDIASEWYVRNLTE